MPLCAPMHPFFAIAKEIVYQNHPFVRVMPPKSTVRVHLTIMTRTKMTFRVRFMCPGEGRHLRLFERLFYNKQECTCDEALNCRGAKVNCPDSDPSKFCDCASDCTTHPEWCTYRIAQLCCANFLSMMGSCDDMEIPSLEEDLDEDEDCLTIRKYNIYICVCGIFFTFLELIRNYKVLSDFRRQRHYYRLKIARKLFYSMQRMVRWVILRIMSCMMTWTLECTKELEMLSGATSRTKCMENEKTGLLEKYQKGGGNRNNGNLPQIIDADINTCNSVVHVLDWIDKFD